MPELKPDLPIPPIAKRVPQSLALHSGSPVDEYSWLHHVDDPEVSAYLQAERDYHDLVTAPIQELSEALRTEMVRRTPEVDRSVSYRLGEYSYYTRFAEGTEYGTFVRESVSGSGSAEQLLDLDQLAEKAGADYLGVGVSVVSPDARLLAWSVDLAGDEVYELFIRDLTTGIDLPERMPHTYYGAAWSSDSRFLFYTVNDEIYRPYQVWRHEVGRLPSEDILVLDEPDQRYDVSVAASRSGDYIFLTSECRDTQETWLIPTSEPTRSPVSVGGRSKGHVYTVSHGGGDRLFALTNSGSACEFRLVTGSAAAVLASGAPAILEWPEVLAHNPDIRLVSAEPFQDRVVVLSRTQGGTRLEILSSLGVHEHEILPTRSAGSVEFGINLEWKTTTFTLVDHSYIAPSTWWDIDLGTGAKSLRHRDQAPNYAPDQYRTELRWADARDGARIPITLAWHKDTALDHSAPCLMYGYGAYEFSYEPEFDASLISLLDRGFVFAHAHVRGGGEMGRKWWDAGHLQTKLNSFFDFIDVTDYLARHVVDPERIVSRGGSAGGLLVMASLALAPDRWRAVVAEVPFVDVINSMSDPEIPLTVNEWDEWGNPSNPEEFAYLMSYSPYENVPVDLTALVLLTGAVHDPRVLIREPAKWTAKARHLSKGGGAVSGLAGSGATASGILFRPELGAGSHGGAAGRYAHLADEALTQAIILRASGVA